MSFAFKFTKLLGLVDVEVLVYAGGSSSQAGAIRYAISLCLRWVMPAWIANI